MHNWLPPLDALSGPKYRAIADAITQAIRTGALRPGERLPAQRELAAMLAVDLTTVTRSYGILRDAGLIEGAGKLGSYVRNGAEAALQAGDGDDTGMNMPPQPGFALIADSIRTGLVHLLRAGGQSPLLQYQPSGGNPHDRRAAAALFTARGMPTTQHDVVVTAGGQNALHAIVGTALATGDTICTGRHIYPGMRALALRFGLRIAPVDGDAEGVDPDALGKALAAGARALYLVPTNDNPTTATIGLERRHAIAALVRAHGTILIEDDAYGQLPARPLPAIASLAPEHGWHIASTAKIISPVLRVAHVRTPSANAARSLAADVHATAVMAPPLNAALVTAWIRDGSLGRLVAAVRAEAVARQRIALRQLAGLDVAADPEGYHLWLKLADGIRATELTAAVRPLGLSIVPAEAFAVDPADATRAVRISIGGAIDHDRLQLALDRVRALARQG